MMPCSKDFEAGDTVSDNPINFGYIFVNFRGRRCRHFGDIEEEKKTYCIAHLQRGTNKGQTYLRL